MIGYCQSCKRKIGKLPTHCLGCGKYYHLPECAAGPFCICLICGQSRDGYNIPAGWKMTESGMRCHGCIKAQSLCAAGPWRTDVENAEHEWVAVWYKDHPRDWFKARLSIEDYWETARYERTRTPDAFAAINPPEVKP